MLFNVKDNKTSLIVKMWLSGGQKWKSRWKVCVDRNRKKVNYLVWYEDALEKLKQFPWLPRVYDEAYVFEEVSLNLFGCHHIRQYTHFF